MSSPAASSTSTARRPSIAQMLASADRPLFSFEFAPPRDEAAEERLWAAFAELEKLHPDFVSVTYGANGSTRHRTIDLTRRIAATSVQTMGHLTCVDQSTQDVAAVVDAYAEIGVHHVLAIRGDMPGGPTVPWVRHPQGLSNATELVRLVKSRGDFCVGVAAFPDIHPQQRDAALDARVLVEKAEAGAEFAITQLFFSPQAYFNLVERVRKLGCSIPIIPGIIPVTNVGQIRRFAELSGAELPATVVSRLQAVADDPVAVRRVGSTIASDLAVALLRGGAPGLHFFTQNRSIATREIFAMLLEHRW